jgi:hypothetical protein
MGTRGTTSAFYESRPIDSGAMLTAAQKMGNTALLKKFMAMPGRLPACEGITI